MRKVLFRGLDKSGPIIKVEDEYKSKGFFHGWGKEVEDYENGGCEYTVAIVEEFKTGKVHLVLPDRIKFVDDV